MGVSTLRVNLSEADIRALIKGDTDEDRALACYRLCRRIDTVTLSDDERAYAEQILQIVVTGAAERVRRALAVTLKFWLLMFKVTTAFGSALPLIAKYSLPPTKLSVDTALMVTGATTY